MSIVDTALSLVALILAFLGIIFIGACFCLYHFDWPKECLADNFQRYCSKPLPTRKPTGMSDEEADLNDVLQQEIEDLKRDKKKLQRENKGQRAKMAELRSTLCKDEAVDSDEEAVDSDEERATPTKTRTKRVNYKRDPSVSRNRDASTSPGRRTRSSSKKTKIKQELEEPKSPKLIKNEKLLEDQRRAKAWADKLKAKKAAKKNK